MTQRRRTDLQSIDDMALMVMVAKGDREAFSTLMRRHEDLVFSVAVRVMGDRQAALDATQETFLTVYRKADRFRGEAAFTTWLYKVTTNTCYDLLRKMRRRHTEPLPETNDPPDLGAQGGFESVDLKPLIETALAELPRDFAVAVVLSDIEGLSLAEIAEVVDAPIGTVKSRIFRGRRLLAEQLRNLIHDSDI